MISLILQNRIFISFFIVTSPGNFSLPPKRSSTSSQPAFNISNKRKFVTEEQLAAFYEKYGIPVVDGNPLVLSPRIVASSSVPVTRTSSAAESESDALLDLADERMFWR